MQKIQVGDKVQISKTFTEKDVQAFANLSLDFNPIHLDADFAKETQFEKPIVHGMLVSSLFSGLMGKHLPGEGSIYLAQELKFKKPVFLNQEVTATVEVIDIREDKPIITLSTVCKNDQGRTVISGQAVMMYKSDT